MVQHSEMTGAHYWSSKTDYNYERIAEMMTTIKEEKMILLQLAFMILLQKNG
ncbi:MAG: hypothetical protein HQ505_05700 [Nitrosopumilus sp.]|nr:hypothetical protein [Nitrosopumilus sp.]